MYKQSWRKITSLEADCFKGRSRERSHSRAKWKSAGKGACGPHRLARAQDSQDPTSTMPTSLISYAA